MSNLLQVMGPVLFNIDRPTTFKIYPIYDVEIDILK